MGLTRRDLLAIGSGALVSAGLADPAASSGRDTSGKPRLDLIVPSCAEVGRTTPIAATALGAREIRLCFKGFEDRPFARWTFAPGTITCTVAVRRHVARTGTVVAIAEMHDGTRETAAALVTV